MRFPTIVLLLLLLLSTLSPLLASAAIDSVRVEGDTVIVRGRSDPAALTLTELHPHEAASERGHALELGPGGEFELSVPRTDSGYDRILSRWRLGDSPARWAHDVSGAAAYPSLEPMRAKNRKGLGGIHPDPKLFSDLVELGVGHITVNISLRSRFGDGQVRQLDQLLTFAHKNGIVVTAILLIPPRTPLLAHPDCDPSAHYALPDMTSAAGVAAFAASVRFLAERYCEPGFPHGRISHWIVGNEVDAGWVWTNAGEMGAEQYMDQYTRALRVAHYSVRSFDPHGKVYISLTHHWNSPHKPEPNRFYRPRHLLELLRDHCKLAGDFEWGLAYHPYPDELGNPRTWEDKLAHDDFDSPLITMKNIDVLDRFMRQPEFRYRGEKVRTILLSEQGYHTVKRDPDGEKLQAAAIAYAWEKMKPLASIEAFHYHRWIDHEREGGLRLGLWTVKKGSITWPERKKQSWEVYRALGTGAEAEATAFADEIIGAKLPQ
jgi:hypothetical protein